MRELLTRITAMIVTILIVSGFAFTPVKCEAAGKLQLPAPEIIGKSVTQNSAVLEWKGVLGANGYFIYKYNSKTKKYKKIGTVKVGTTGTYSYTVTGLKNDKSYKFKIAAYVLKFGKKTAQTKSKIIKAKTTQKSNPVKVEYGAKDFFVYDGNGKTVNLSDFAGKPIIVNIWATWCGPCVREMLHFEKLYGEYGDEVAFLMVNLEASDGLYETDYVKEFIADRGYTFPVYYDLGASANKAYGTGRIPLTVAVDRKGEVIYHDSGALYESSLRSLIEEVMK